MGSGVVVAELIGEALGRMVGDALDEERGVAAVDPHEVSTRMTSNMRPARLMATR